MPVTISSMPRKPKQPVVEPEQEGDRHKPSFMVRLPVAFAGPLDELVGLHQSDRTEEVKIAVREYLQRNGLWRKSAASDAD